jgi:hypothetical protein
LGFVLRGCRNAPAACAPAVRQTTREGFRVEVKVEVEVNV